MGEQNFAMDWTYSTLPLLMDKFQTVKDQEWFTELLEDFQAFQAGEVSKDEFLDMWPKGFGGQLCVIYQMCRKLSASRFKPSIQFMVVDGQKVTVALVDNLLEVVETQRKVILVQIQIAVLEALQDAAEGETDTSEADSEIGAPEQV